jgi:asparagine synthase (glutamine-hydrolysing)
MDEPSADSALITSYLVSEFASREVKVILSGVGGDELFGGYSRYLMGHYVSLMRKVPAFVRRNVLVPLITALPEDRHSRLLNLFRYLRSIALLANANQSDRYRQLMEVFGRRDLNALLTSGSQLDVDALTRVLYRYADCTELDQIFAADLGTQLTDELLLLTDKMSMSRSLECRVPLLDERLIKLATTIPADLRIRAGKTRYILKKALRGVLPKEILDRKKRGFGAPMGAWLRKELEPVMARLLDHEIVEKRGILDPHVVGGLVEDHRTRRADHTDQLMALITLELWCRLFLDSENVDDVSSWLAEA